ncbi:MAG: hypothetical protein WC783_00830 [Candidatus Paceibacterota bacterium]|jgi:phage FluMu protein Com
MEYTLKCPHCGNDDLENIYSDGEVRLTAPANAAIKIVGVKRIDFARPEWESYDVEFEDYDHLNIKCDACGKTLNEKTSWVPVDEEAIAYEDRIELEKAGQRSFINEEGALAI